MTNTHISKEEIMVVYPRIAETFCKIVIRQQREAAAVAKPS